MNDAIDKALGKALLEPPGDFTARIMARLPARPEARHAQPAVVPARRRISMRELLEWLALTGAVLAGSAQLIGLLFGVWIFTSTA